MRRSAANRLQRLWVRIPPGKVISCVLSGRGLCDELITRPEEIYLLFFVVVCDLETSRMRWSWPTGGGAVAPNNKNNKRCTKVFETFDKTYKSEHIF